MKRGARLLTLGFACSLALPLLAPAQVEQIEMPAEDKSVVTPRLVFLQRNFTNFQAIPFRPATTNSETVIQRLKVNPHMIGTFRGRRFTGFRFNTPEWLDGDLEWMYFHLTDEAHKRRRVQAEWFIIRDRGEMKGFDRYFVKPMNTYPELKGRYPNSREVFTQRLDRGRLEPGRNYAIWFAYSESTGVPDIAVALTIHSERGHQEFGILPAR